MDDQNVQLDMSKAQPLSGPQDGGGGVTLDMSKAQPITPPAPPTQPESPGIFSQIGDTYKNYEKGIVKGALQTTSGLGEVIHKAGEYIHPGLGEAIIPQSGLTAEKAYATPNGTAQHVGVTGETIAEFIMGDEYLKGLSMSAKLAEVSKVMKLAEKSPYMAKILHLGATTAKAAAELSPEEVALVKEHPVLAKLLGTSLDAVRAGTVQGAQTTVKTGGDVGQGATDALVTGALTGGLGAITGAASHVLGKGKQAAETVARMGEIAKDAPSATAVEDQLANATHGTFSKELGTLQNNLDDATSTVGMFGEGAPASTAITAKSKEFATEGKKAVHGAYQKGLDKLVEMAGDKATMPLENSPIHKAAQELAASGEANAGPLDEALNVGRPGSAKVNRIVDNLNGIGKKAEEAEPDAWVDHNGVKHVEPTSVSGEGEESLPPEIGMNHLVEYRQKIARMYRDLSPTSPDYRADKEVYQKLLKGTDDTIGQLADSVGADGAAEGPSAGRQHFDAMNNAYREGIQPFQNRDVKNILKGNLNNVSKSLMGGQTSIDDIAAVKKALGPKNFQQVSTASLQNIVQKFADADTGEVDYKKLFQQFNKIDPDVRSAMFGNQGQALSAALKTATTSEAGMGEIGKKITGLLGNGDIDTILKTPAQAKELARTIGPDGMKAIGNSILENKIGEASTALNSKTGQIEASHFDPDKVLNWWMEMKNNPEVRDSFFTVDAESSKHYNEMMKDLSQASSVKKLVKYGVLPVTLGTAGVVHGPLGALVGALAGLGTEATFGRARDILDTVANNPKTWKALSGLGKAAEAVHEAPVAKTARSVFASQTAQAVDSE